MYRVRSYPFVFIENWVGKMVVIIASVDDAALLGRIMEVMAELPSYGYRRVWTLLRRQSEVTRQSVVNAKRVYRAVIPPYSGAFKSRGQAARARCCFGV